MTAILAKSLCSNYIHICTPPPFNQLNTTTNMLKKDTFKWRSLIVAHEIQAHWYSVVLQLLSFTAGFFVSFWLGLHKRQKSLHTLKLFWSESAKTYVHIAPPDLQSDLGTKSGFINLVVKFKAALKNDSILIKWKMLRWILPCLPPPDFL